MRTWFWTLLLLVAAVALAVVLREHSGNVIVILPPWRVQVSTTFAALLIIALFVAIYVSLRLLGWLFSVPGSLRTWHGRRAQRRDHDLLERGWVELLQGRYAQAERDLSRLLTQTKASNRKAIAALSAARAAHGLGKHQRRDALLGMADDYLGDDQSLRQAAAVAGADMLLEQGRAQEALARLGAQQDDKHCPLHVARLMLRAHAELGHHAQILSLARNLVRRGLMEREQASPVIDQAGAALLGQADGDAWHAVWKDFKSDERTLPRIALAAACGFESQGKPDDATRILEAAISARMAPELLAAYARCDADQVPHRLEKAETWRKKYPDDPDLLASLGELCLIGQIWGTAERYLQRSLSLRDDARVHALLGNLYERLDRPLLARHHWRQAAAAGKTLPLLTSDAPLPAADTRSDPIVPDVEGLEELTPFAMGGSAMVVTRAATSPDASATRPVDDEAVTAQGNIEELFDSAVPPSIDPLDAPSETDKPSHPSAQDAELR